MEEAGGGRRCEVWCEKGMEMCFVDQSEVLALIIFMLDLGGSGHPHLLGILPHLKHWYLFLDLLYIYSVTNYTSVFFIFYDLFSYQKCVPFCAISSLTPRHQ